MSQTLPPRTQRFGVLTFVAILIFYVGIQAGMHLSTPPPGSYIVTPAPGHSFNCGTSGTTILPRVVPAE